VGPEPPPAPDVGRGRHEYQYRAHLVEITRRPSVTPEKRGAVTHPGGPYAPNTHVFTSEYFSGGFEVGFSHCRSFPRRRPPAAMSRRAFRSNFRGTPKTPKVMKENAFRASRRPRPPQLRRRLFRVSGAASAGYKKSKERDTPGGPAGRARHWGLVVDQATASAILASGNQVKGECVVRRGAHTGSGQKIARVARFCF